MMALKFGMTTFASGAKKQFCTSCHSYALMGKKLEEKLMNNVEKLDWMKKPGKNLMSREVLIRWDVEDCGAALPPPPPLRIFENVQKYLHGRGLHDELITFFYGYGSVAFPQPGEGMEGITYFYEPDRNSVYREMLKGTCASIRGQILPPRIFFISGNRDFTRALCNLKERRYPIVVAQIDNNGELLEWPEISSLDEKNSQGSICEFESNKIRASDGEMKKYSEPNVCESESPLKDQSKAALDLEGKKNSEPNACEFETPLKDQTKAALDIEGKKNSELNAHDCESSLKDLTETTLNVEQEKNLDHETKAALDLEQRKNSEPNICEDHETKAALDVEQRKNSGQNISEDNEIKAALDLEQKKNSEPSICEDHETKAASYLEQRKNSEPNICEDHETKAALDVEQRKNSGQNISEDNEIKAALDLEQKKNSEPSICEDHKAKAALYLEQRKNSKPNICEDHETKAALDMEQRMNSEPNACEFESTSMDQRWVSLTTRPNKEQQLGIFWDLETCSVPKGVPYNAIAVNIRNFLIKQGRNQEINTFNVYGDISTVCQSFIEGCKKSGISLIDNREISVLKAIVADMLLFSVDYPCHSTILLISGKDYLEFCSVLDSLESDCIETLIAVPDLKRVEYPLIRDYSPWEWPQMVTASHK